MFLHFSNFDLQDFAKIQNFDGYFLPGPAATLKKSGPDKVWSIDIVVVEISNDLQLVLLWLSDGHLVLLCSKYGHLVLLWLKYLMVIWCGCGQSMVMHLSMLSRGEGRAGGGDFDKAFMTEGVAFEFMDSPQGADI